jgi:hypothetical protein
MKKSFILLITIVVSLLFAACSFDQQSELEAVSADEEAAETRASNPEMDAKPFIGIGGRMYVDLAVSNNIVYFLHENGNVMRAWLRSSSQDPSTLYRNYNAIDYVTDGSSQWGLIGASDETKRIYVNGDSSTGNYGVYPSDVTYVQGIAGRHIDSKRIYIYIKVPNQYFASHVRMGIYDKRISNHNSRITWYSTQYPYGAYCHGLCANGSKLMKWLCYYENKLYRWTAPNGSSEIEDLGSYDSHGYTHGGTQYLNPLGFDYCPYDATYYCLDNTSSESQCIVKLKASDIEW